METLLQYKKTLFDLERIQEIVQVDTLLTNVIERFYGMDTPIRKMDQDIHPLKV